MFSPTWICRIITALLSNYCFLLFFLFSVNLIYSLLHICHHNLPVSFWSVFLFHNLLFAVTYSMLLFKLSCIFVCHLYAWSFSTIIISPVDHKIWIIVFIIFIAPLKGQCVSQLQNMSRILLNRNLSIIVFFIFPRVRKPLLFKLIHSFHFRPQNLNFFKMSTLFYSLNFLS